MDLELTCWRFAALFGLILFIDTENNFCFSVISGQRLSRQKQNLIWVQSEGPEENFQNYINKYIEGRSYQEFPLVCIVQPRRQKNKKEKKKSRESDSERLLCSDWLRVIDSVSVNFDLCGFFCSGLKFSRWPEQQNQIREEKSKIISIRTCFYDCVINKQILKGQTLKTVQSVW